MIKEVAGLISTYSALIPIAAGYFFYKNQNLFSKFWYFLLYGLLTDLLVGYFKYTFTGLFIYNLYSLLEIVFLFLFFYAVSEKIWLKKLLIGLVIGTVVSWFLSYVILHNAFQEVSALSPYYDRISYMVVAVVSAFLLLKMTESGRQSSSAMIWLLIGVFFYHFCSSFIMSLVGNIFTSKVWFMNNLFNVLTMLIYTKAFYNARKEYMSGK
jgi:hypothetical protein